MRAPIAGWAFSASSFSSSDSARDHLARAAERVLARGELLDERRVALEQLGELARLSCRGRSCTRRARAAAGRGGRAGLELDLDSTRWKNGDGGWKTSR